MRNCERSNLISGTLYFYIHFVTEVICFYVLYSYVGDRTQLWLIFLAYDMLAFVPQSIIGYVNDRYPRLNLGTYGLVLLAIALILSKVLTNSYISLIMLCLGNCLVHINGAEVTLRSANGKLSGSAIFVAGGSFGVVTGRLLAGTTIPFVVFIVLLLSAAPMTVFSQRYIPDDKSYDKHCSMFDLANPKVPAWCIIIIAALIVAVRGYMGYGIPTSWNKTVYQTIMLYVFMGVGKALGGILSDFIGCKKTAIASTIIATPLIMIGDNLMLISLIGVMFFSMTMAITLGLLASVLPDNPGFAFGITTTALFIGTAPVFVVRINDTVINSIMLLSLSIVCVLLMCVALKSDRANGK